MRKLFLIWALVFSQFASAAGPVIWGGTQANNLQLGGLVTRGTLSLQNLTGSQPILELYEDPDNGTNKMQMQAAATLGADFVLTWPVDDGTSNQVLSTNGTGTLTWASPGVAPTSMIRADTAPAAGHGSTNTTVRRFVNFTTTGSGFTATDSAGNGSLFTVNEDGVCAVSYSDRKSSGGFGIGISINASGAQLSTTIESMSNTNRLASTSTNGDNGPANVGATFRCAAGDLIRAQDTGDTTNSSTQAQFIITQVAKF